MKETLKNSSAKALIRIGNSGCRECPLYEHVHHVCLMGKGNPNAELMLVGEAPGETEDQLGEPFVGRAGTVLNELLEEFKIKREDIYITNAVKCRPPNNRTPHVGEMRACRHYLLDEIKTIQPKVILALGGLAMKSLLNETKFAIAANRGMINHALDSDINEIPVFVTYHPAAILRDERYLEPCVADFERVKGYLEHGAKPKAETKYYKGTASPRHHIVFDLETSGLNMFDPTRRILCVGTSVHATTGYCTNNLEAIRGILEDASCTKIAHNLKFDYKFLRTRGYKINGPVYCTMVGQHLLDENCVSFGLKELAAVHTDMAGYAHRMEKTLRLVNNDVTKVPEKILHSYCAMDVDASHRLYDMQVPQLEEQGLWPLTKLTMAGMKVMAEAEIAGVSLDMEKLKYLSRTYRKKIAFLYKEIEEKTGLDKFNPDSGQQLGKILTGKFGLKIIKMTKTGRVSVDKHTLDLLESHDKTGFVTTIKRLRKLKGDYAKYLHPERPVYDTDGYVHTDYRISGTDTGRYSCTDPNLQAMTKDSPIKEMFVSRFKKGKLVQLDYDQGELRLLAQYSNDTRLMRAFNEGQDIHKATAAEIFGIPLDKVTDEQRFAAKTINFGIIYGMGADKLARTINISVVRAAGYIRQYKKRLTRVNDYIEQMGNTILKHGEVKSLFGRRRRIPISLDETVPFQDLDYEEKKKILSAQRKAVNAPIQGGLHDLNILSVVALNKKLRSEGARSKILLVVHDSTIIDCPEDEWKDVIEIATEIYCNPDTSRFKFTFNVPLTVSVGYGTSWKDASEKRGG